MIRKPIGERSLDDYLSMSKEELSSVYAELIEKKLIDSIDYRMVEAAIAKIEEKHVGELKKQDEDRYTKRETSPEKLEVPGEGRPIGEFAEKLGEHYRDKEKLFYRPEEGKVVMISKENSISEFKVVTPAAFVTEIENAFEVGFNKLLKYGPLFVKKSITQSAAQIVLASETQFIEKLPVVRRIYQVPLPVIKDGKLVFPKSGYDPGLLSFLPADAPKIDTTFDVNKAKEIILQIYSEFCFVSEQDRTNAIAALLTPFCRGLYSTETARTPLFFYKANRERAGKDYCAGITGIVYEGEAREDTAIVSEGETHDEEFRKKVLGKLKSGSMRIHSSNNKGYLNSTTLESFITATHWEDRQLGSNLTLRIPNMMEVSISGNLGITYTPDIGARAVPVNMFFGGEDPNQRQFKTPDLHKWVLEHRSDVLSALYALVRDWIEKGAKPGSQPFTSFPEWARVVGGVLENAGLGNPCVGRTIDDGVGGDKETTDMKKLFEMAHDRWGGIWIKKIEIVNELKNPESGFFGLFDWLGFGSQDRLPSAQIKLSHILAKFKNREFGGVVMEELPNLRAMRNQYRFRKMEGSGRSGQFGQFSNPPHSEEEEKEDRVGNPPNQPNQPPKLNQDILVEGSGRSGQFLDAPPQPIPITPPFTAQIVDQVAKKRFPTPGEALDDFIARMPFNVPYEFANEESRCGAVFAHCEGFFKEDIEKAFDQAIAQGELRQDEYADGRPRPNWYYRPVLDLDHW